MLLFYPVLSSAVSLGGDGSSRSERGELAARHLSTVVRAVNFLLTHSPREPLHADAQLLDRLLSTLLLGKWKYKVMIRCDYIDLLH